jgi:hypothetical protein
LKRTSVSLKAVLGPLIFLIFINELPLYIKNGLVTIFADETSVMVSVPNKNDLDTLIEETMEDMRWWCARNKLVLNINKTSSNIFKNASTPKC